jgi:hypothetical protein
MPFMPYLPLMPDILIATTFFKQEFIHVLSDRKHNDSTPQPSET